MGGVPTGAFVPIPVPADQRGNWRYLFGDVCSSSGSERVIWKQLSGPGAYYIEFSIEQIPCMEAGDNSDDSPGGSHVIQDYFGTPESSANIPSSEKYGNLQTPEQNNLSSWVKKRLFSPSSMWKMFSLPRIPWISGSENDEKVELTKAEIESIHLEIATAEEREAHLKAKLEHVDEILRSARLAGYLYTRTRWTSLPWEPPVDDADVDDWLQHFMVLHGSCIFLYLHSSDLSPQDSILLTEIVEVGVLTSFIHHENETRYSFSMLTRQGLRYECSSSSKVQVDAWLSAIRIECKMDPPGDSPQDSSKL